MSRSFNTQSTYRNSFIWDAHAGFSPFADLELHFLKRWRDAGVGHVSINVGYDMMRWDETIACVAHYRRWLSEHSNEFLLVERFEDLRLAKKDGKLSVTFDLEGANALDGNIEMIGVYHQLGVRQMNLAYNRNNAFGGGCHDDDIALTDLGKRTIAEMNRVGMMVDCTHTGYKTSMDVMAISTKPVVFSHSNAFGAYAHPRNVRDDQIQACAATGGVVCVNGVSTFIDGHSGAIESIVDHIDYIVRLVGTNHVGIGLDTVVDPKEMPRLARKYPAAWPDYNENDWATMRFVVPEQLNGIAEELANRQYSPTELSAIIGGNMLRVASNIWR
ncbi:dipeptidase [Rhizobium leguminosarum]|uniref:dipeptidase n=1 Tax=Rhizobium leguminosarum TaxID=384 RepID=UPI00067F13EF|nr:membrane dipeptidase [Rhizobium leguminosarum]WFT91048.1 membrane dipeptidase [Rhizobium leguminosarum]